MSRTPFVAVAGAVALLCCVAFARPARAGAVQFQIGEQDFADGKTPVYSREIREAGAGETYPFDGTIFGNDVKPFQGAFDYEHTIDLGGGEMTGATLTIGLIDIDSPAERPLETVAVYFDGVRQPTGMLRGISASGVPSSVEVVDIPVPVELLADGKLQVSVVAAMPGYGNLGNAIEADFSRLVVQTSAEQPPVNPGPDPRPGPFPPPIDGPVDPGPGPNPVPLPPALIPAGLVLAALAAMPRRRLRAMLEM
jgi:hypothetical protein